MKYNFNELKEIVKSKMSLKRFTHTLGVVEMSEKLAKIYNADIEKCKVAALLHDICKEMDMEYIKNILAEDEVIVDILSLNVYINSESNFKQHSKLADFASEYLFKELGKIGIASRTSVGVISLPGNAPVEIQIIAAIK